MASNETPPPRSLGQTASIPLLVTVIDKTNSLLQILFQDPILKVWATTNLSTRASKSRIPRFSGRSIPVEKVYLLRPPSCLPFYLSSLLTKPTVIVLSPQYLRFYRVRSFQVQQFLENWFQPALILRQQSFSSVDDPLSRFYEFTAPSLSARDYTGTYVEMKTVLYLSVLLGAGIDLAVARPANLNAKRSHGGTERRSSFWNAMLSRREVPQEHSHAKFITIVTTNLNLNNPDKIKDAVFGLLGNAAGSKGQGDITDTDCLQQATADQAFSNAKDVGDVDGMTAALVYRALERNTGSVGLASVACTSIQAVNPEIAAISQHQDPASDNAASTNKDIALALAFQIANIGGNPLVALQSGTFAPGTIGDTTGKGNSCDTEDDAVGCIFSENLLVKDATEDEVNAAVAASATNAAAASNTTDGAAASSNTETAPPEECTADASDRAQKR